MSLTVRENLVEAIIRLEDAGIENAKLDAEVLLLHTLKKDKSFLITGSNLKIPKDMREFYQGLVEQRAEGKPVQYIIGEKEFMALPFKVNEKVLIPRADTETMVELAIEELEKRKPGFWGLKVLDLCCGSGAIAVSIAQYIKKIKVTASDISEEALSVARENAAMNQVGKKIKFVQGDLLAPFKKKPKFDMIISNPPYIKTDIIDTLQKEIKHYEPRTALDGGEDGLDFYRRILPDAAKMLKNNGILLMEIGHDQAEDVRKITEETENYTDIQILQDLSGLDRILKAVKIS